MNRKWKKKRTEAGFVFEECIYLSQEEKTPRKKGHPQSEKKEMENFNRRYRDVGRLINANFDCSDYFVVLTYSRVGYEKLKKGYVKSRDGRPAPYVYDSAEKTIKNFVRRCTYYCKHHDIPFRYIFVTSNQKAKDGRYCRIHHHMIVNYEAWPAVKKLWDYGKMRQKQLRDQVDYTPLAYYMLVQTPCRPGRKNVGRSMNLQKPFERIEVMKNPNEQLTPPEGAKVLHKSRNKLVFTYKNEEIEDEDGWLKWMGEI